MPENNRREQRSACVRSNCVIKSSLRGLVRALTEVLARVGAVVTFNSRKARINGSTRNRPNECASPLGWIDLGGRWSVVARQCCYGGSDECRSGEPSVQCCETRRCVTEKTVRVTHRVTIAIALAAPEIEQPFRDPLSIARKGERFRALADVAMRHANPVEASVAHRELVQAEHQRTRRPINTVHSA